MKGLGSAGFSIAQLELMRRALVIKWVPVAAAYFCKTNDQKSNKYHFFPNVLKMQFF